MTSFTRLRLGAAGLAFLGAGLMATNAWSIVFHNSDGSIQGSLCVGTDCVLNETFGSDTIRLKEEVLRIHFVDTSTIAGFPTRNWRIVINDNFPGGADYFAIEDTTGGGDQIFRVDAGAPENSLYVNSSGLVGLGTATPARQLHIRNDFSPGIRLEQDGSGGGTPQTWDMLGSDVGFRIFDVTNNTIPFLINTGAPFNSFHISSSGRVGMGTTMPDAPLEVRATPTTIGTGNAIIKLANVAGPTAFQLDPSNDGIFWNFSAPNNTEFRISRSGTGGPEMSLTSAGDMTITGAITTGGMTCGGGCDRVFAADYDLPSVEEHANQMWQAGYLPNVGPTPEGEPINVSDKLGRMLNELEKAHIYIAQLSERDRILEKEKEALQAKVDGLISLETRVAELERLLSQ